MRHNYLNNHSESQKSFNDILHYIVYESKTTRRAIQKETLYSWGTVSSVVSLLIDKGIVYETESVSNGVGRGTSYLIPRGDKFVSIGVDINSIGFTMSVVGLDSKTIYFEMMPYETDTYDYTLNLIYQAIQKGIDYVNNRFIIASIGISCQGFTIDGSIYEKFKFAKGWENVNLKKLVEDKFHVFTYIEHDVSCLLEAYKDEGKSENGLLICRVVSGIGFSLLLNSDKIKGIPIDFGNSIIETNGDQIVTLEDRASSIGIAKRAGVDDFSIINADREKYRRYLDDAADALAVSLVNIFRVFSPAKIVLTGMVVNNDETMQERIKSVFKKYNANYPEETSLIFINDLSPSFGAARISFLRKIEMLKTI